MFTLGDRILFYFGPDGKLYSRAYTAEDEAQVMVRKADDPQGRDPMLLPVDHVKPKKKKVTK